jgi:hypothetical protein
MFMAYAMAHKGKTTSDVSYNLEDPPEAYSNISVYTRINEYTSAARSLHGDDYDPSSQDFDPEVVKRIGGCKKHGWYYLGDGIIDATSIPSLSQIRARSTNASIPIRPRLETSQQRILSLQVISVLFVIH